MGRQVTIPGIGFDDYYRFLGFITKDPITGCWNWRKQGKKSYGCFSIGKVTYLAHRFSYIYHNGSIDEFHNVLHRCNNTRCVNPAHLYEGTQLTNRQQAVMDGRTAKGESHGKVFVSDLMVARVKDFLEEGASQTEIAKTLSVPKWTVNRIHLGQGRFNETI